MSATDSIRNPHSEIVLTFTSRFVEGFFSSGQKLAYYQTNYRLIRIKSNLRRKAMPINRRRFLLNAGSTVAGAAAVAAAAGNFNSACGLEPTLTDDLSNWATVRE